MDINITGTADNAIVKHDVFGAIYFEYNEKLYLLYISPLDDNSKCSHTIIMLPIQSKQMMQIDNNNIDYYNGTITQCSTSLKENVQKNLEKNEDIDIKDYFPESKFFIYDVLNKKKESCIFNGETSDNENDNNEYEDDIIGGFTFYGSNSGLMMDDTVEQFPCNYDTLIAKGDAASKNFIFMAECGNGNNSFRITIFTSGTFILNIIGSCYVKFNLVNLNGKLDLQIIDDL